MSRSISTIFRVILGLILYGASVHSAVAAGVTADPDSSVWLGQTETGEVQVELYFFWSRSCPHCQDAQPYLETMPSQYPWIRLHSLEISGNRDNLQQYRALADAIGQQARSVPAFFICGTMLTGWDNEQGMGKQLLKLAELCRLGALDTAPDYSQELDLNMPLGIDADALSLPLLTLVLAGLDAFNPCAFFILLFLLSLLVHARSRKRMLLVGLTFVLVSGMVYFLFMAAWLNLFLIVGGLPWITFGAGALAVAIGLLNAKEYFLYRRGPRLAIPDTAKPGLIRRMAGLLSVDHLPTLLFGTLVLAVVANSYELLCTAGFPMVFTRTLTLHDLGTTTYYAYLLLYNVIYIIPLLVIVIIFTRTLGARKLGEYEGQLLKLLSGLMMLMLGGVLILAPDKMGSALTGVLLLVAAVLTTGLVHWVNQRRKSCD